MELSDANLRDSVWESGILATFSRRKIKLSWVQTSSFLS